jgi:hypothetical protein
MEKRFGHFLKAMGTVSCALSVFLATSAVADGLGRPSRILDKECHKVEGVMSVCAVNRGGQSLPQLDISYSGYLTAAEYRSVVVWVSLNGETGFFHLRPDSVDSDVRRVLGLPVQEFECVVGQEQPDYPRCPDGTPGSRGDVRWVFDPAPEEELVLFRRVKDEEGAPKAWSLEFAFVSENGRHWDSMYGKNYRFHFEKIVTEE